MGFIHSLALKINASVAKSTSGSQHASTVRSAIVSGGQQHASMLGAATAGGGGGGFLSGLGGVGSRLGMVLGAFSEGGVSTTPVGRAVVPMAAFRGSPSYANGTANTSGIPAILHPSEPVVPLSCGRKIPFDLGDSSGAKVINMPQTFSITTPDADSFRRSKTQIAADMARAGQNALGKNG